MGKARKQKRRRVKPERKPPPHRFGVFNVRRVRVTKWTMPAKDDD